MPATPPPAAESAELPPDRGDAAPWWGRRLGLCAALLLDAWGALRGALAAAARLLAALLTVWADPFGRSRGLRPLRGRCEGFTEYCVLRAGSERERRAAAWLYRWHDIPEPDDWAACARRFGLRAPPAHVLYAAAPDGRGACVEVSLLREAAGWTRRARVQGAAKGAEGPVGTGALLPAALVRAALRAQQARHSPLAE
jgi:hypothetical protein